MSTATNLRQRMRQQLYADETRIVRQLIADSSLKQSAREAISQRAERMVSAIRETSKPAALESFLAQYELSSEEGVALMCLAEALLRVPDSTTVDALIHDKIVPANWGRHLGASSSSLVNASTWALLLTGKVIGDVPDGIVGTLQGVIRKLGEPVIRTAVGQAIRELGSQFVLGETIDDAVANSSDAETRGFTYSYDMLGEAARTDADARRYHLSYSEAIASLGVHCTHQSVADNPGISVKLSALYPRYEYAKKEDVMIELVGRTRSLAMLAKSANMGFNIDAEEADRLDLSLDVIEAVLSEPSLAGWAGFGIVVQAYSKRALVVIDWLYELAGRVDRQIMVRLVKGAYWDTEIKRAQVLGVNGFPVFTRKANTDISYLVCAERLLALNDRIYPQFATHNAHSVAGILSMVSAENKFEFQRLHGMGEALHEHVLNNEGTRCRIYAPVGAHEDLLAYLVRRLLENGANSSFVNQIVDTTVSSEAIAQDPFSFADQALATLSHRSITMPADLYQPGRKNSKGIDLTDPLVVEQLTLERNNFRQHQWQASVSGAHSSEKTDQQPEPVRNPADANDIVGYVQAASAVDIDKAFIAARQTSPHWANTPANQRANILNAAADRFEDASAELMAVLAREAGKTQLDAVAEIREAVDFLRYYAERCQRLDYEQLRPRGCFVCISPWNFPLAIFTGQIAAALATGNTVIAKPAEQTPLVAYRAVTLLHEAGIPERVLQLLPGPGSVVGAALVADQRCDGVCFTGSTATAQQINLGMANSGNPTAPLIAETGGLNAMIVDSTALPEQAVRDIVASAFQSAGQRCSALRVVLVQEDLRAKLLTMLSGAMEMLSVGDPWLLSTDVGPVIDQQACANINQHIDKYRKLGKVLFQNKPSDELLNHGTFINPTIIEIDSVSALQQEIFGPVLHVVSFAADQFADSLDAVNSSGYGLTFGLHSRVDERVQDVVDGVHAGNLYINRNQIGAVVGSQPFGGHGLSGTGPKAGGPHYLTRFVIDRSDLPSVPVTTTDKPPRADSSTTVQSIVDAANAAATPDKNTDSLQLAVLADWLATLDPDSVASQQIQQALNTVAKRWHKITDLPGPTGESNRLRLTAAGCWLCIGREDDGFWLPGIAQALAIGNPVIAYSYSAQPCAALRNLANHVNLTIVEQPLPVTALETLSGIAGLSCSPADPLLPQYRLALAKRAGAIVPLISSLQDINPMFREVALCIDTTASGGNATLLAIDD